MLFQTITIFSLTALSAALPYSKRTLKARQSGPVLADTTYNAISISGGTAGNAEQEALDVFSALDLNNLANIDEADIAFLNSVNKAANGAETGVFNSAIEAATGAEKNALAVLNCLFSNIWNNLLTKYHRLARPRTKSLSSRQQSLSSWPSRPKAKMWPRSWKMS